MVNIYTWLSLVMPYFSCSDTVSLAESIALPVWIGRRGATGAPLKLKISLLLGS